MRKPIIAGNWKMYKTEAEGVDFGKKIKPLVADAHDRLIVVCAPFPALSKLSDESQCLGWDCSFSEGEVYSVGEYVFEL